jgi:hypothetical protein
MALSNDGWMRGRDIVRREQESESAPTPTPLAENQGNGAQRSDDF